MMYGRCLRFGLRGENILLKTDIDEYCYIEVDIVT